MDALKGLLDTLHKFNNQKFYDMRVEDSFLAGLIIGSLKEANPNGVKLTKVLTEIMEISTKDKKQSQNYLSSRLKIYNKYRGIEASPVLLSKRNTLSVMPDVGTQESRVKRQKVNNEYYKKVLFQYQDQSDGQQSEQSSKQNYGVKKGKNLRQEESESQYQVSERTNQNNKVAAILSDISVDLSASDEDIDQEEDEEEVEVDDSKTVQLETIEMQSSFIQNLTPIDQTDGREFSQQEESEEQKEQDDEYIEQISKMNTLEAGGASLINLFEGSSLPQQFALKSSLEEEAQNAALIQKMMAEEEAEIQKVRSQRESEQDHSFTCKICFEIFESEAEIMPLKQCEHIYHKDCMEHYFGVQIQDRRFPLKCPDPQCIKEVADADIREILSKADFNKYQTLIFDYTILHQADMSWCPTANCKFAFFFDENAGSNGDFRCQSCKKHYCLTCMVPFHTGMSCATFMAQRKYDENEDKFLKFVKGSKFKQCPKCKIWVQKTHGCDHMHCPCGKHFCYRCGGIYKQCECYINRRYNR